MIGNKTMTRQNGVPGIILISDALGGGGGGVIRCTVLKLTCSSDNDVRAAKQMCSPDVMHRRDAFGVFRCTFPLP